MKIEPPKLTEHGREFISQWHEGNSRISFLVGHFNSTARVFSLFIQRAAYVIKNMYFFFFFIQKFGFNITIIMIRF